MSVKITELPIAAAIIDTDLFAIVQGGITKSIEYSIMMAPVVLYSQQNAALGFAGLDANGLISVEVLPDIPFSKITGYVEKTLVAGSGITINESGDNVTISFSGNFDEGVE